MTERYHLSTTMLSCCGAVDAAHHVRGVRPIERWGQYVVTSPCISPQVRSFTLYYTFRKIIGLERLQETRRRAVGNCAHGAPVRERSRCQLTAPVRQMMLTPSQRTSVKCHWYLRIEVRTIRAATAARNPPQTAKENNKKVTSASHRIRDNNE